MHKFMRTVGFSMYQKKQDMAKLLKRLVKEAEMTGRLAEQEGSRFCELRTEVAPGMGCLPAHFSDGLVRFPSHTSFICFPPFICFICS